MLDKNFIAELKSAILQSRYNAARLVNRELIQLYLKIGAKISTQTKEQAWGSKVLEQVSNELQSELPGLKGFSATNLKRMTLFFNFWNSNKIIRPTLSGQLYNTENVLFNDSITSSVNDEFEFSPTLSNQLIESFLSTSFSNHYIIASKVNSPEEAMFYLQK